MFPIPARVRWSRSAALTGALRFARRSARPRAVKPGASGSSPSRAAIRVVREPAAGRMSKAPSHPEVNQETPTALEPKNQILAPALQRRDALAEELGRHHERVLGPRQARIMDVHTLEASADDCRLEPPADRLDLRQLGHARSLAPGCPRAAPAAVAGWSRAPSSGRP